MLKPAEMPPPGERSVGELVHQLIEDGKAFARAELGVAKAIGGDKVAAYKLPAILIAGSLFLLQSAVTAMAVGISLWLLPLIGPLLAGLIAFLIFAGLAGLMVWIGLRKIKDAAR
jgi:hypothetical protein